MSGHTKGPWHVDFDGEWKVFGPEQGEWVADCGFGGNSESCARLIAAAPELLEALEALLEAIPKQTYADWWPDELTRAVHAAKAAIAKAEVQS